MTANSFSYSSWWKYEYEFPFQLVSIRAQSCMRAHERIIQAAGRLKAAETNWSNPLLWCKSASGEETARCQRCHFYFHLLKSSGTRLQCCRKQLRFNDKKAYRNCAIVDFIYSIRLITDFRSMIFYFGFYWFFFFFCSHLRNSNSSEGLRNSGPLFKCKVKCSVTIIIFMLINKEKKARWILQIIGEYCYDYFSMFGV